MNQDQLKADITRELRSLWVKFNEEEKMRDAQTKAYTEGPGSGQPMGGTDCAQAACQQRVNIRSLISERIQYHYRAAEGFNRLLRAIPEEMHPHAEETLASLLLATGPWKQF